MTSTALAIAALLLALVPGALLLANLTRYRPAPRPRAGGSRPRVSALIPARDEEENIAAALESVLASTGVDLEVIVLDDGSTDRTVEVVQEIGRRDDRVRLVRGEPLPPGWNGKMHACWLLSQHARHDVLVFLDADVRVSPDGLARMAAFLDESGAELASGIPKEEVETVGEQLIIPLIHFVLLGFLPIHRMRRSVHPAYGTGIGQLMVARREAYERVGGHRAIAGSRHDGVHLPQAFRSAGLMTDLFDATDVASCRMYRSSAEVWQGFLKNADQGLGSPRLIGPVTLALLGGQVLPFALLMAAPIISPVAVVIAAAAALAVLVPRIVAALRFRQPVLSALLHPVGILGLVAIQWHGLLRKALGRGASWKGRTYPVGS